MPATPATRPTASLARRLKRRLGLSALLLLVLAILAGCGVQPAPALPGNGDAAGLTDDAQVVRTIAPGIPVVRTADLSHAPQRWRAVVTVEKRLGDDPAATPYEVVEAEVNLLTTAGANTLWTALSGGAITAYNATNTYLGVGTSTTAPAAGQTSLMAVKDQTAWAASTAYAVGNVRRATSVTDSTTLFFEVTTAGTSGTAEPTWPTTDGGTVTDGGVTWTARQRITRNQVSAAPTVSTNQIQWSATFGTADANYVWNEWAVFNASTGGTMLNRATPAGGLGTKTSAASWTLTVTLSLS